MDKVKLNIQQEEKVFDQTQDIDGVQIAVCSVIPERDKEIMAQRLAFAGIILDDNNGAVILPYDAYKTDAMIILDMCTNVDIDWVESAEDRDTLVDYLNKHHVIHHIERVCPSVSQAKHIAYAMIEGLKEQHEKSHSVINRIMEMFSGDMNANAAFESATSSPEALAMMRKLGQKNNVIKFNGNDILNLSKRPVD